MKQINRCHWVTKDPLYITYHDQEWGVPSFDDTYLFEMLVLEGAQAGLSWITILKRRENYRSVFAQFDPEKVSQFDEEKIALILRDKRIIRNKLKVRSAVKNAQAFLNVQDEFESFSNYIWGFVDGEPILNDWATGGEVPAATKLSTLISKELKKRGFTFVGPVICYSYMQAIGMVNDHIKDCQLYHGKNV